MSPQDDTFSKKTQRTLAMRASYICSNPKCRTLTLSPSHASPDGYVFVGVVAAISATEEGGPRWDPTMSGEDRASEENGIFLCEICASAIDKKQGSGHPRKTLVEWKEKHESWVAKHLNRSAPAVAAAVEARAAESSRARTLRALCHELFIDGNVLRDGKFDAAKSGEFVVYPRLHLGVAQSTLSSGIFAGPEDESLLKLLYGWVHAATEFNTRLSVTEATTARGPADEVRQVQHSLAGGPMLEDARSKRQELSALLLESYSRESGVDASTILSDG